MLKKNGHPYSNKYLASILIAIRQQLAQKGQLIGRLILYFVIVYLFSQVFQSVEAGEKRIWYLAITEWVTLSTPAIAYRIAEDIRSGQVIYFMLRPLDYLWMRFCECIGIALVRFIMLMICCFGFAYYLTGLWPSSPTTLMIGIGLGMLSVLLYSLLTILIGVFSFWLKEIQPLIYLNLTATFCFGGLIVPLSFYSETLRSLSFATPYPWMLWWPAEYMTGNSPDLVLSLLAFTGWLCLIVVLIVFLYQKCLESFVSEGG